MEQQAIIQSVQSALASLNQNVAFNVSTGVDVSDKQVIVYQNVVIQMPEKDTLSLSEFAGYKGWSKDKAREWLDLNPRYEVTFESEFSVTSRNAAKKKRGNKSRVREVNMALYRKDLLNPPFLS